MRGGPSQRRTLHDNTLLWSGQIPSRVQVQSRTVAVLVSPGAVLTPWSEQVAAALLFIMPGQEYGLAAWDVLFGVTNPGGKLPVTLPSKPNEPPMDQTQYPGVDGKVKYSEGLQVGYRWYHAHGASPHFPFGHGLSYTSFLFQNLTLSQHAATVNVSNQGRLIGSEVAQLYLTFPAVANEPPRQLKGFGKVVLQPGEHTVVTFPFTSRTFSIWNATVHGWAMQTGTFLAEVGSSSQDIRLQGNLHVTN